MAFIRQLRDRRAGRRDYRILSASHFARARELSEQVSWLREDLVSFTEMPFTRWGRAILEIQDEIGVHSTDPYYEERYRGEELLYWLRIPQWIHEWAETANPRRMVDIGPGYGTLAAYCASFGVEVGCIDIHLYRLSEHMTSTYNLTVILANVEKEGMPEQNLDGVVMTEVIEHFNFNPIPTMAKICAALRPGGRLFLSTPDAVTWGRVDHYQSFRDMPQMDPDAPTIDDHIFQYYEHELLEVLEEAGFKILRLERSPGRWGFHFNIEAERPLQ